METSRVVESTGDHERRYERGCPRRTEHIILMSECGGDSMGDRCTDLWVFTPERVYQHGSGCRCSQQEQRGQRMPQFGSEHAGMYHGPWARHCSQPSISSNSLSSSRACSSSQPTTRIVSCPASVPTISSRSGLSSMNAAPLACPSPG